MARGLAYLVLGLALRWNGDLAGAVSSFSSAEAVGWVSGDSYVSIFAACYKGYVLTLMGQLHKALKTLQGALEYAEKSVRKTGWKPPISGLAHTFMCSVLIERNELETALASAKRGLELSQKMGHAYAIMDGYFFLISALIELGDYTSATREVRNARNFADQVSPWASIDVLLLESKLHLAQGDIDKAAQLVSELELKPDAQYESMRFNQYLLLARILIAKHKSHKALKVLARLLDLAGTTGADGRVIEVLVLQAIAYSQDGDEHLALDSLCQAVSMAEPEGYVLMFLNEGAPMEGLLRMAADRGIASGYVGKLLADFKVEKLDSRQEEKENPSLQWVEPLSEREIQVLCLLDTNMTGVEIAELLHLAPSTVQTHCKNIYRKLDVHRRFDAVRRARELELL
jgi:LuxR family maltose regulon positive regulatory protein